MENIQYLQQNNENNSRMRDLNNATCDHGPRKALCNHLYYFKNEHQQTERRGMNRYVIQILTSR